jgi:hypothetical protein
MPSLPICVGFSFHKRAGPLIGVSQSTGLATTSRPFAPFRNSTSQERCQYQSLVRGRTAWCG